MLVKRWGSPNRVGRLVSTDVSIISEEVDKAAIQGSSSIISRPNFHLFCQNVDRVKQKLVLMEPLLKDFFAYGPNCSNVTIRPEEFIYLYKKIK
jgi:hypothetical protein